MLLRGQPKSLGLQGVLGSRHRVYVSVKLYVHSIKHCHHKSHHMPSVGCMQTDWWFIQFIELDN